ncbi:MAG: hypothetical protein H6708_06070 [Kofleriaceae bacterium]|nr:hypothetical protein [Kofleriaceae bacterium]
MPDAKAWTVPSQPPTTSRSPAAASPASTGAPTSRRCSSAPVAASSATTVPSVAAAHTIAPVTTGAAATARARPR